MSNKKTILVIEDDTDSRAAICTILETLGHQPLGFASGKEALAGIVGKNFDMALVDYMMPEMNGHEVISALRKLPGKENLLVIMITARDGDSEMLDGYKHGADYYIPKPFTAKQLQYGIDILFNEE